MSYAVLQAAAGLGAFGDINLESSDPAMCAKYNCPMNPEGTKCQCMVPEKPSGVSTPNQYLPKPVADPAVFYDAFADAVAKCEARGGQYNFVMRSCQVPKAPAPVVPPPAILPQPGLPIAPPQVPVEPAPTAPALPPFYKSPAGLALIAGVALIGGVYLFRKKHGPLIAPMKANAKKSSARIAAIVARRLGKRVPRYIVGRSGMRLPLLAHGVLEARVEHALGNDLADPGYWDPPTDRENNFLKAQLRARIAIAKEMGDRRHFYGYKHMLENLLDQE